MSKLRVVTAMAGAALFGLGIGATMIVIVVAIIQFAEDGQVAWWMFAITIAPALIGWAIVRLCGARLGEMLDRLPSI